jgi:hypothetical protein
LTIPVCAHNERKRFWLPRSFVFTCHRHLIARVVERSCVSDVLAMISKPLLANCRLHLKFSGQECKADQDRKKELIDNINTN